MNDFWSDVVLEAVNDAIPNDPIYTKNDIEGVAMVEIEEINS
jgi:hypothetical protein